MNKKYFFMGILLVVFFSAIGLLLLKKPNAENKNNSVTIALPKSELASSYIIGYGIDHDFFAKQGVDVKIIPVEQGGPFPIVAAGQADLMLGGLNRPLAAFFNNVDSRLLANGYVAFNYFVLSRFDNEHVQQIKRAVVNAAGGETQQMTEFALKNLGVDPKKVEYVSAPSLQARLAMIASGDADFTLMESRTEYDSNEAMHKYFLLDPEVVLKNSTFIRSFVSTKQAIEKNPDNIQRFIVAAFNSMQDMKNNRNEAIEYAKNKFNLTDEQANGLFEQFLKATEKVSFIPEDNEILKAFAETNKKDSSNPQKNLSDFIFDVYAKKASK